jgi:hypothetical protein
MPSRYTATGRAIFLGDQGRDPTLALWLRRGVDQYTDVAASTPASTGNAVAAWRDRDIIATQATVAARPTRQAGGELAFTDNNWLQAANQESLSQRAGFTVAVWANQSAQGLRTVVGKDTTSGANRDWLIASAVNGAGSGFYTFNDSGIPAHAPLSSPIIIDQWTMIMATISTDGASAQCWRNGVTQPSVALTGTRRTSAANFFVGGVSVPAVARYFGFVSDIRIWHRALGASEIAALFAAERGRYGV